MSLVNPYTVVSGHLTLLSYRILESFRLEKTSTMCNYLEVVILVLNPVGISVDQRHFPSEEVLLLQWSLCKAEFSVNMSKQESV